MKIKDIVVGVHYYAQGQEVIVLEAKLWHTAEVRVPVLQADGTTVITERRTERGPGRFKGRPSSLVWNTSMGLPCAVKKTWTDEWYPRMIKLGDIIRTWDEHDAAQIAAEDERRRVREEAAKATVEARKLLAALLVQAGAPGDTTATGSFTFARFGNDVPAMQWLIGVLEGQEPRIQAEVGALTQEYKRERDAAILTRDQAILERETQVAAAYLAQTKAQSRCLELEEENKDLRFELDMDYDS